MTANIAKCISFLSLFLMTMFEYGSYKAVPFLLLFLIIWISLSRRVIAKERDFLSIPILLTTIIIGIFFGFDFDYDMRWLSFILWVLFAWASTYKINWVDYKHSSNYVIIAHIFFAFIDFIAFHLVSLDLSSYLFGLESRHITNAKPFIRATGLMGEPGTLASMLLCLSLISYPKKTTFFFIFIAMLIVKSPYLVLAIAILFFKRYPMKKVNIQSISLGILISLLVLFVMGPRIIDILTGIDSSFLYRVDALSLVFESRYFLSGAWFGSSHLIADVGFFLELVHQFGLFLGALYAVLIAFISFPLLLIKMKAFVGFFPLFVVYRKQISNYQKKINYRST